ncbi:glycosyltransferase [Roseibacillus ishigakijimensis]|uniref:Glycosyltransferase n=1 Tax=Roseibacillus ishigakijimensis TaxID=454146 RepID=A0A934VLJ5_9BACT|nr:glycosyltransferase [Roseibacillus ishigakijimensis]MBK1833176.1 glycosyltransferase [Roseibacillus ishigakijimensis]
MTTPSPEFSVVMAVRNAESTVQDAIRSLQQQTLAPSELIVVLNGCSDGSWERVTALAAVDPRLRLLSSSPEGGVAEAARVGCAAARHPLLARMDADDWAHPERFARQWATWQATGADLVTSRIEVTHSLGAGLERFVAWANDLQRPEDFRRERFVESPVIQPGVLMTKAAYEAAGGYRVEDGPEDYDLWLRMLEKGARFVQAPEALLHWRDSPQRLTRSHEDYSQSRMTATKARHLGRLPAVRERGVTLAGGGPIGRALAKLLLAEGVRVHGFFEVNARKIGRTILGLPVWGMGDFGQIHRSAVLLGCVGRGGRERVRTVARQAGYREGTDFFACC